MKHADIVKKWNALADGANQWSDLDEAEKIEFALSVQSEFCAAMVEAEHVGKSVNDDCDTTADAGYNRALRHSSAAIRAAIPDIWKEALDEGREVSQVALPKQITAQS
jgi:hypothetical protein